MLPPKGKSFKELQSEQQEQLKKAQEQEAKFIQDYPALNERLLYHIANNIPIKLRYPIHTFVETFQKHMNSFGEEAVSDKPTYEKRTISPGTTLEYVTFVKSMNQMVFRDANTKEEYEIYTTPVILLALNGTRPNHLIQSSPNVALKNLLVNLYEDDEI